MDSDPDLEIIEKDKDSGMSSLGGSKNETPERSAIKNTDSFEDEPDETIGERISALTEMFPEGFRNVCGKVKHITFAGAKSAFLFSCNASWFIFTSATILFLPVIVEAERARMVESTKLQQKQVLLGTGSVMMPGGPAPALPPMQRS